MPPTPPSGDPAEDGAGLETDVAQGEQSLGEDAPPGVPPQEEALLALPPEEDATPDVAPEEDAPPAVPPQEDVPPEEDSPPDIAPEEDAPPAVPPQEDAPPAVPPQKDVPPDVTPEEDAPPALPPQEAVPPAVPPQEAAPPAVPPQEAPPPAVPPQEAAPPSEPTPPPPAPPPPLEAAATPPPPEKPPSPIESPDEEVEPPCFVPASSVPQFPPVTEGDLKKTGPAQRLGTLTEVIRYWADKEPNRPAFVFRSPRLKGRSMLSFSDLYLFSRRYAKVLKDHGIRRGEAVVVLAPNSPERAVVEGGLLFLGAVSVNGLCELPGDGVSDLVSVMKRSKAVALLMDIDYYKGKWETMRSKCIQLLDYNGQATSCQMPHLRLFLRIRRRRPIGPGDLLYDMNNWYYDTYEASPEPRPQDACAILTTAGVGGYHHLVLHSHRNLVAFSRVLVPRSDARVQALYLNAPLGSATGHLGLTLYYGMKRVLMDARAGKPVDTGEFVCLALWEENCVSAVIAPHIIPFVAKTFLETESAHKIMFLGVTGEKVTRTIIEAALHVAHVAVVSFINSELFMATLWMVTSALQFRDYCVGVPIPSVQVRIVDDRGKRVPLGVKGNVEIRTPLVFRGYANDQEATDACFTRDGYFKTNDLGWLEEGDMLFVEGRRDDIITRGSLSFYPAWLEAAIERCPGVVRAIVVGIPDPAVNQEICACVVTTNNQLKMTTIREFVENNFFRSPRPRYYLHFQSFPENQTDKENREEVALIAMRRLQ